MRMTSNPILIAASTAYAWFFRGIPVLVQLIFWYNLALLFPAISLGFPGVGWLFALSDQSSRDTVYRRGPRSWSQYGRLHG